MFERFTDPARQSVIGTQEEVRSLNAPQVLPVHLLVGIVAAAEKSSPSLAALLGGYGLTSVRLHAELQELGEGHDDASALESLGIDVAQVRRAVDGQFGEGTLDGAAPAPKTRRSLFRAAGQIPFSAGARDVLTNSLRESKAHGDGDIGVEHLLLGLLRGADPTAAALINRTVEPEELRTRIQIGRAHV